MSYVSGQVSKQYLIYIHSKKSSSWIPDQHLQHPAKTLNKTSVINKIQFKDEDS